MTPVQVVMKDNMKAFTFLSYNCAFMMFFFLSFLTNDNNGNVDQSSRTPGAIILKI